METKHTEHTQEKAGTTGKKKVSRRQFMLSAAVLTSTAVLASCGIRLGGSKAESDAVQSGNASSTPASSTAPPSANATANATATALAETPACGEESTNTPAVTEGPYFTANSPERSSLLQQGLEGTLLTITGYVLSKSCQPVKHALLDFWHADAKGEYDNKGYTLRGHQYTDDQGKFTLQTIVPGLYPGRSRHIHVKAQAPNEKILTTQLFFPNEPGNAKDNIFKEALLMNIRDNADGSKAASFNFVVQV
ncbi:Catechol 1,2-dioxygenase 2 [compost metagenome]